ncbi:hypothetical protein BKA80DRAFT_21947 [Phyllosticta citrichinensis]
MYAPRPDTQQPSAKDTHPHPHSPSYAPLCLVEPVTTCKPPPATKRTCAYASVMIRRKNSREHQSSRFIQPDPRLPRFAITTGSLTTARPTYIHTYERRKMLMRRKKQARSKQASKEKKKGIKEEEEKEKQQDKRSAHLQDERAYTDKAETEPSPTLVGCVCRREGGTQLPVRRLVGWLVTRSVLWVHTLHCTCPSFSM